MPTDDKQNLVLHALVDENLNLQGISSHLGKGFSRATVHRQLQKLIKDGYVVLIGSGKNSRYQITDLGRLMLPFNRKEYFSKDIEKRGGRGSFNFSILETLKHQNLFTYAELLEFDDIEKEFVRCINSLSPTLKQKEMERLAIDLSWKSSRMEGNSYSLLQTEVLLKDFREAKGKTKLETQMVLNHKRAIDYVLGQSYFFENLTTRKIEEIHRLLIEGMGISPNIRRTRVGITGTNYVPPDNEFQIKESLDQLCEVINQKSNVLEKSLLALLLIAYIQPFEDGNKRTSRIVSNAILLANNFCPISFRTTEPEDYRGACLIFYEQNSIAEFKRLFIEQFKFSTANYF